MDAGTAVGLVAAACTSLSYLPQLRKCTKTGSAGGDLSMPMLATLGTGLACWIAYGAVRGDSVIVVANVVGLVLVTTIVCCTLKEGRRERREPARESMDVALRRSEERYQAVVESTHDYAIFTTDRMGKIVDWYPGAAAVFGWSREEIVGRDAEVLFVPEDRAIGAAQLELSTAEAKGVAPDVRWHQHKDGGRVFIEGKVMPIVGHLGPDGFLKIGQDVTARRRAERALRESEQHLQIMVRELQHRTRNVLAVVQALFESTMRDAASLDAFRTAFSQRLSALSRAQGLLSSLEDDAKLTFDALLRAELSAHGAETSPSVALDGPPDVPLRSRQVQILALALHELATNAVKYGALASPAGRLAVQWRMDDEDGLRRLHVDWREGGVAVDPAVTGSGYGRELIEKALPYQLDAATTYEFTGDGVHCTITIALDDEQ